MLLCGPGTLLPRDPAGFVVRKGPTHPDPACLVRIAYEWHTTCRRYHTDAVAEWMSEGEDVGEDDGDWACSAEEKQGQRGQPETIYPGGGTRDGIC